MTKQSKSLAALLDKVVNIPCIQITLFVIVFLLISMFSLSAQTPRKDSGADGLLSISGTVVSSVDGKPVQGVSIRVEGEKGRASSNKDGSFSLQVSNPKGKVSFSHVGFKRLELPYTAGVSLAIKLIPLENQLEEVEVVSTGLQRIPKERAAGSFELLDNKSLNKRVGLYIMDRLENISNAVRFDKDNELLDRAQYTNGKRFDFDIRGRSVVSGSASRTIILDNVVYDGDLRDINPNDIESVSILKDAVATSLWGTYGGGGVIVLTTKKGKLNAPTSIDFNSSVTVNNKPNIYALPFMKSSDYIDLETYLFKNGYYDYKLQDIYSYQTVSPVVELLDNVRQGRVDSKTAEAIIAKYRTYDVRDDYNKYVYRNAFAQQYHLQFSGGNQHISYSISGGYNRNNNQIIGSFNDRKTVRSSLKIKPLKKMDINLDINYSKVHSEDFSTDQRLAYGLQDNLPVLPYMRLVDEHGNPTTIDAVPISRIYRDTAGNGKLLDWTYNPLKELGSNKQWTDPTDLLVNLSVGYKLSSRFDIQGMYSYENVKDRVSDWLGINSYAMRNMINLYTQWDDNQILKRPIPVGDRLHNQNSNTSSQTARLQLNYTMDWQDGRHKLIWLGGSEIRQKYYDNNSMILYGYDPDKLTSVQVDFVSLNPIYNQRYGGSTIHSGLVMEKLVNRFVSYYSSANYTFLDRYIFSGNIRQDASNLFGVKANQKWQPLWSAGLAWSMEKEPFMRSVDWIDQLKWRVSYGFAGQVNPGFSGRPLIYFNGSDYLTGLQNATLQSPGNPSLTWERVKTINAGLDFSLLKGRLNGSMEYYRRNSIDLITSTPVDPTTGFLSIMKNGGELEAKGFEITLNSVNMQTADFNWKTRLLMNRNRTKVIEYNISLPFATQYITNSGTANTFFQKGYDTGSVFAFPFGGLDPNTGDPIGFNKGEESKDYFNILYGPLENFKYIGPGLPVYYGNITNEFNYKNWSLSFNIQARLGHYFFRQSFSEDRVGQYWVGHQDYEKRWQQPGDELNTNVPSLVYPIDPFRDEFYSKSSVLVEKGDNIRLQDLSFSYTFNKIRGIKNLSIYGFVKNINWILWRANKLGLDPEYRDAIPLPTSYSLGMNVKF
ncbi:SusC/RagA family TonB-linked outer membrane protein [Sphingobacterium sp. BIGb0165]|uniref:SusC/RagA family TonB-linked outer membrane protein n=1 Tax=Sphingobacterium sp. BIGb0165 TaxID=2940615 RepID=UPI0021676157|nr:SusC/RagA family TonB-linked outer membrane protein [Sphingobacterium sp. BIGb0165]MCS4225851.1 TonB-linked SusC/RagA family outer membrane protein [Sphingobacterium sp. BIGb0165]